jgi:hypothetical protein
MSMPKSALRNSLLAAVAVGTLPLLAGCGGSSGAAAPHSTSVADSGTKTADGADQLTVPDGVDDATKKQYLLENAIATCMKKQGFTYTPHVAAAPKSGSGSGSDGEDYASMKAVLQKYGYGNYSGAVYPDDPMAPGSKAMGPSGGKATIPPDDDEAGFTAAQLKAYDAALNGPPARSKAEEKPGGCSAEAQTQVNGPPLSLAVQKQQQQAEDETNRENGLELNGDAQLVQLAQQYAGCLTAQGITVTTTQPTGIVTMVQKNQGLTVPENHNSLSKEVALPLLTHEIDLALKDLDCGKKFRAAYYLKEKAHPYWGDGE